MLVAPAARGLFSRAITGSGPCSFPLPELSASEATGSTFTQTVGCQKSDATETVACLRQLSADDVLAKQPSAAELLASPSGLTAFFPNVDGKLIPQQTVTALNILGGAPLMAADYPSKITATAKALAGQNGRRRGPSRATDSERIPAERVHQRRSSAGHGAGRRYVLVPGADHRPAAVGPGSDLCVRVRGSRRAHDAASTGELPVRRHAHR